MVTYNISASSITPHLPFALCVGGALGTDCDHRSTSRVEVEAEVVHSGNQGFSGFLLRNALSRAGVPIPFTGFGLAGLRQLVGPVGASDLCSM